VLSFMARFDEPSYALMRGVSGLLFLWHGSQKLFSFPLEAYPDVPAFITYGAGGIELIGGVLVMVGLFTRPAAFVCSGTMAVAYWMAHGTRDLFPIVNGGELAALYCFVFLFIAARGPGVWSLDGMLSSGARR